MSEKPLFETGTEWAVATEWGKREFTEAEAAEWRRIKALSREELVAEIIEGLSVLAPKTGDGKR